MAMNNMVGISWKSPYSFKQNGTWLFTSYDILFEEDKIMEISNKEMASRQVAMLNGAYNLGASAVIVRQSFSTEKKSDGNTTC